MAARSSAPLDIQIVPLKGLPFAAAAVALVILRDRIKLKLGADAGPTSQVVESGRG
jgi:hypothetical protein